MRYTVAYVLLGSSSWEGGQYLQWQSSHEEKSLYAAPHKPSAENNGQQISILSLHQLTRPSVKHVSNPAYIVITVYKCSIPSSQTMKSVGKSWQSLEKNAEMPKFNKAQEKTADKQDNTLTSTITK